MARFWLLYPPDGSRPHQVATAKRLPLTEGDNPAGWRAAEVNRHSHDPREHFDEKTRRWKLCPALTAEHEARERAAAVAQAALLSDAVIEALADRVAAKLNERKKP